MSAGGRLASIDLVRGLAMVVMALDHVRDYVSSVRLDILDPQRTTWPLFMTRWVTHVAAPVFVFLAGTAAFLWASKGRRPREVAAFLATRGLWLVLLELTVVRLAWDFDVAFDFQGLQVIWVIGVSMIVLAALVCLPTWAIAAFGAIVVAGHNLLDGVSVHGPWQGVWRVLHEPGHLGTWAGVEFRVAYPLLPWPGLMALGYAFGRIVQWPPPQRNRACLGMGAAALAAFAVLRLANVYGDPSPWAAQGDADRTLMSFLNVTKYPASLLFLLPMTGLALLALPLMDRWTGRAAHVVVQFGRVPLFYYVVHLYLIHGVAVALGVLSGHRAQAFLETWWRFPDAYGFGLVVVYLVFVGVVMVLYPLCQRFADFKRNHRAWWVSYL